MESISRLRTILLTSLGSRGAQHGEQGLFDELMVHQPCLLKLFDVGPRNPQEQREIESGACYYLFAVLSCSKSYPSRQDSREW